MICIIPFLDEKYDQKNDQIKPPYFNKQKNSKL